MRPIKKKLLTDAGLPRKVRAYLLCFIVQVILIHKRWFVKWFLQIYLILLKKIIPAHTARPAPMNNAAAIPLRADAVQ